MVGPPPADYLVPALVAPPLMIRTGNLECGLVGLRPAAHRKDTRQTPRRDLGQLFRELNRGNGGRPFGEVRELDHLLVSGLRDLLTSIADVDRAVAAVHVDPRVVFGVGNPDSMTVDDEDRVALLSHLCPVAALHPEVSQRRLAECLGVQRCLPCGPPLSFRGRVCSWWTLPRLDSGRRRRPYSGAGLI